MTDIEKVLKQFESCKSDRANWEQHWEEISERVLPRQRGFVGDRTRGEKKMEKVFDSTSLGALRKFASVMDSTLTPEAQKWHSLKVTDDFLNRDHAVKEYLYQVNNILFANRYNTKSNFTGQNYERWTSMGAFGTGSLFIDYDKGLRYKCLNLKNTYFLLNHQGVIYKCFRTLSYTAQQAVEKFGPERLPEKILKALENPNEMSRTFDFVHYIAPREAYDDSKLDAMNMPFKSCYIALEGRQLVEESGYTSWPFSISRYVTAPDETYGRSPAMEALPDIKMLNEMSKTDIRAAHKLVNPPILMHDDGLLGGGASAVNMKPGGLNVGGVDRNGKQLIQPFNTGARLDINEIKMEQRREAINDAFLVTLFQILVETPRMTATEALIRAQEKGMLLTPTLGRQKSEALGPLIERELDLLAYHGKLPPMPQVLVEAGGEYEIVYDSPLSRMQRAEELVGVQRSMELLAPFTQMDPTILDIFDKDKLARLTAEVSGVPMTVIHSPDEVAKIRQARAEAEQEQSAIEAAQPIAGAMKDAAQANQLLTGA